MTGGSTRLDVTVAEVRDAKARENFQQYLDGAEIAQQQQLRGRKRRVTCLTLMGLERRSRAADLLIVNFGIRLLGIEP